MREGWRRWAPLLVVGYLLAACAPARSPDARFVDARTSVAPGASPSPDPTPSPSPSPTPSPAGAPGGTGLRGCPDLPATNVWHADVSHLPVLAGSAAYVASIGTGARVKADFGSGTWQGGPIGIPITYVPAGQPRVPVSFDYAEDSDRGPYPIPANALVEGGPNADGDRHVLVV